ncbi:putative ABC transporter substrate-binding protein [Agrobacterium rubi TR3 = NBRC 13261]|uniref:Putative ABC transporter substrate-binding protein n=2 Tax=Agrobacterium rubi TaxID=28099 RepID=A0A081CZF9_9HYPH|nr:sugar ABC transporter substrate-binding protein [Agrobacterium rubi]MBP1880373.1 ribose transport system substrate-binding protein [Agrobacterium rubi]GAK72055.1 putative ABC transporter substrate-binding protein [Agrobacterium rubi TR3 = NBRC 13261]
MFDMRLLAVSSFLAASALAALASPASADSMADAKAIIEQHRAMPVFTPPGEAFDAKSCMAGKKVLSIPISMTIPFNVELQKAMSDAAKEVGFTYTTWDNQLKIDQWVQGVSQAISQKYDALDLAGGLNPEVLGPQLGEARAAGLKISTTHFYDVTQKAVPSVDYSGKVDFSGAGKLLAAWAYVQTEGKPNVLVIGSSDVLPSIPFVQAIKDELKALCADCKVKHLDVPVSEWATKIQSGTQSALLADPSINYILPIYDSMSQFVIPAMRITGAEGSVKLASFNGTPFVLDMVRAGQVQMDVGESLGWAGYAAIDNIMRMLCGKPEVAKLNVPLLVFDESNIATAGTPANFNDGYGDAHLDGFRKLWKLK